MRDLYCKEAKEEEDQEEIRQSILARFQDALPSDKWEIRGRERLK
jgi:hypothetical protein